MFRMVIAVFVGASLAIGIFYQMHLQHEESLRRAAEFQVKQAEWQAQEQHRKALEQYDRDIKSLEQLGRMFQQPSPHPTP